MSAHSIGGCELLDTETTNARLAADYETVRRSQYELITSLLDILPRIDGVGEEGIAQVRDALFHADHPFMIVFVGPFSSGKSSLINALLGEHDLLRIGPTPTTDQIAILRWGEDPARGRTGDIETFFYPSPLLQKVSFVDTPGLESIFKTHEDITRKFLHRSDTVLLIMLATQAMSKRNIDYLQYLKDYGKTVILVINQIDLLSAEEIETVRQYVTEQSRANLGYVPEMWFTSARLAMNARLPDGTIDSALWHASGLDNIETYIERQLGDVARLRQKLQTPLTIVQNVHRSALTALRSNQGALDHYQTIAQNIDQQIAVCKREQERSLEVTLNDIRSKFDTASERGEKAIRESFALSRGLRSVARGVLELFGLSGLARRTIGGSYTRAEFETKKVFEPIRDLPSIADKLAPTLEGRDIQDIDDLVKYARREIDALPDNIREKVIGTVQAPIKYDRSALIEVRTDLNTIEDEALQLETDKIERAVRNTLLYTAGYQMLLLILGVFALLALPPDPSGLFVVLIVLIGAAILGLAFLPLRGQILASTYGKRMATLRDRYTDRLRRAAEKQIAYSVSLRHDTVAPLTRMIEGQTGLHSDQLKRLQATGQQIMKIEEQLAAIGKSSLFGLKV